MRLSNILLTLIVYFIAAPAFSFFHFEPGIGYNRGHFQTSKAQGIGLTVKTGVEFQSFFLLADIGYHDLQFGSTPTSTQTDAGLAIGGDFKKWRFWFTYLPLAEIEFESGGNTVTSSGDGIKLGLSGHITGKAYLNLEVRFLDFNESTTAGVTSDVTQFIDAALLSVSWKLL